MASPWPADKDVNEFSIDIYDGLQLDAVELCPVVIRVFVLALKENNIAWTMFINVSEMYDLQVEGFEGRKHTN